VGGQLSSFKYLSLLNALSGCSYESQRDAYPRFPSVAVPDFSGCPLNAYFQLDGSFMDDGPESRSLPTQLFVMPEHYFLAGGGRTPLTVYQNRKALEARVDLHIWIDLASTPDFPRPFPFADSPHPPRSLYVPPDVTPSSFQLLENDAIAFAASFKTDRSQRFAVVSSRGWIYIVTVSQRDGQWSMDAPIPWPVAFDMTKEGSIFSTARELIRIDHSTFSVINSSKVPIKAEFALDSEEISEDCCQLSSTALGTFHIGKTVSVVFFTAVRDRIICFARSRKFNITAIGCQDSTVRIRSNETGAKVATVSLDGAVASALLITKAWGFIVVRTDALVFVLTVNGLVVQKIKMEGWARWFTFRTRDGFDFIGFNMDDGTLTYFEAADPKQGGILPIRGSACVWTYAWREDCFLVVFERGELAVLPRSIAAALS
jgi:hypothetical protein